MSNRTPTRPLTTNNESAAALPLYSATLVQPPPSYQPRSPNITREGSNEIEMQERRQQELSRKQRQTTADRAPHDIEAQHPGLLPHVEVLRPLTEEQARNAFRKTRVGHSLGVILLAVLVVCHVRLFYLVPAEQVCTDHPSLKGGGIFFGWSIVTWLLVSAVWAYLSDRYVRRVLHRMEAGGARRRMEDTQNVVCLLWMASSAAVFVHFLVGIYRKCWA